MGEPQPKPRWRLEGGFFIIDSMDTLAQMMDAYAYDALKEQHKGAVYAEGKAAGFRDAAVLIRACRMDTKAMLNAVYGKHVTAETQTP